MVIHIGNAGRRINEQFFVYADQHGKNIYSQYGEDGIIEEICFKLGIQVKIALEFGAWNGHHLSNTFALNEKVNNLILIEGDKNKYQDLLETAKKHPSIVPIFAFVEPVGDTSVDKICENLKINHIDLFSVDIDSNDLAIVENLKLRPTLIIVEFNPTFGALSSHTNPEGKAHGNSFYDIYKVMESKNTLFVL